MNAPEFSARLWAFAVQVGTIVEALPNTRLSRHVAEQLVRCGTASAPNYDNACVAESEEVVQKLRIASDAMRETHGWLRFTLKAGLVTAKELEALLAESNELLGQLNGFVQASKTGPVANSSAPPSRIPGFRGLDHIAIAVPDTDRALELWKNTFGFSLLYSEVVNEGSVRLTHLALGNAQLQLVQPLIPDHPLQAWLEKNGPGLHHFCLQVDDVSRAFASSPIPTAPRMHQGTQGKRALFLDRSCTQQIQVELTGA